MSYGLSVKSTKGTEVPLTMLGATFRQAMAVRLYSDDLNRVKSDKYWTHLAYRGAIGAAHASFKQFISTVKVNLSRFGYRVKNNPNQIRKLENCIALINSNVGFLSVMEKNSNGDDILVITPGGSLTLPLNQIWMDLYIYVEDIAATPSGYGLATVDDYGYTRVIDPSADYYIHAPPQADAVYTNTNSSTQALKHLGIWKEGMHSLHTNLPTSNNPNAPTWAELRMGLGGKRTYLFSPWSFSVTPEMREDVLELDFRRLEPTSAKTLKAVPPDMLGPNENWSRLKIMTDESNMLAKSLTKDITFPSYSHIFDVSNTPVVYKYDPGTFPSIT